MKQENKLYIIISFILFILPPFIWGLVEIYSENPSLEIHIVSLLVNLSVYLLIISIIGILIFKKRIHCPQETERKYLLFGLVGNLTIYFYTFQNFMNIDDFVTIYLVMIVILSVYYLLFSRQFKPLELWILAPTFLLIDSIHLLYTGCGFSDGYSCHHLYSTDLFSYILYSIIIMISIIYYGFKLLELKPYNSFKYINIILVLSVSIISQNYDMVNSKIIGTIFISLPFFIIVDFIVSVINKNYQHSTLIFYIRTSVMMGIMVFLGSSEFFYGSADYEILGIMVSVVYSSLTISILTVLLNINSKKMFNKEKIKLVETDNYEKYKSTFESLETINDNQLLFVVYENNIPTSYLQLTVKQIGSILQAEGNISNNSITQNHLNKIESHLRSRNIQQIKLYQQQENLYLSKQKYILVIDRDTYTYIKKL